MIYKDFSIEITDQIDDISKKVATGKISLLELELSPIFEMLKESLSVYNIFNYSHAYKNACDLLEEKFKELKLLLDHLDSDKIFIDYLNNDPSDKEISKIIQDCWSEIFYLNSMSLKFLIYSDNRFSKEQFVLEKIEHLQKEKITGSFLLEIPKLKFTEKLMSYYKHISSILPCKFIELFENEKDQIIIYKNFVFILHLLQLGMISYNKENNMVYKGKGMKYE